MYNNIRNYLNNKEYYYLNNKEYFQVSMHINQD